MCKLFTIFQWKNLRTFFIVLIIIGAMIDSAYFLKNPEIPLLPPSQGGPWIRVNRPMSLIPYRDPSATGYFRKQFSVPDHYRDITLAVTAFRKVSVSIDGTPLQLSTPSSWKEPIRFIIPSQILAPGRHELTLEVTNRMAPPLFQLSSDLPGLESVEGWESSPFGNEWRPALTADDRSGVEIRSMFPTVPDGVRNSLPFLIPILVGTFILAATKPRFAVRITSPGAVRLLLLALWLILGVNNMFKLPNNMGFDVQHHLEYISYLLDFHRLPLASEGSQMFQPPLYYLLSAFLYGVLQSFLPPLLAVSLLRIVPLVCALLMVEICYRLLRELFPERNDLQSIGLFIGGLLPMNLYMCQFVGNEPLTAMMTSLLLLLTIKVYRRTTPVRMKDALILGVVGGLAILAKVTPFLLVFDMCVVIVFVPKKEQETISRRIKTVALFLLTTGIVAGWFFIRNWIEFGKPFIGGWDPSRNIVWWQDPGYRLTSDFYSFGEALRQPVYAAFNGFSDAIYSTFWSDGYLSGKAIFMAKPAWNYFHLAASVAFSVVPATLMVIGLAITLWRSNQREWWPFTFLAISIGTYVAALLNLYAALPIVSTGKASYTMGLTPGYAAMAAVGASVLIQKKGIHPVFISLLVTWGVMTYSGFFVI